MGIRPLSTWNLPAAPQRTHGLQVVNGHGNVGFARGCNIGARQARGQYLLLLNPDCLLSPSAIPALLSEATAFDGDWMLGCRVLNPDGTDQRGSRRALLTPYTAFVEVFRLDRLMPRHFNRHRLNHHESPLPNCTARVPAITGACMMLQATTFRAVGGMDEGYFLHVDDLDLCRRLRGAQIPIYFTPNVEVVHHAGSSQANPIRVEWHKTRGFLRYFFRHYRDLRWLPLVALIGIGAVVRFGVRTILLLNRATWNRSVRRVSCAIPPARSEVGVVPGRDR